MTETALENYRMRMRQVLDHIDQNLGEDLGLEALARVAAFSKYHFHRQFAAASGITWRREAGLRPDASATFNVFHDDPRTTPAADYRMDLCAGTARAIEPNEHGVQAGSIPGGRCAVLRVTGSADNLEPAALFLYRDWLPASGEEPRDFPLYCQRITFFPEVPEHAAITDLYLPLK